MYIKCQKICLAEFFDFCGGEEGTKDMHTYVLIGSYFIAETSDW